MDILELNSILLSKLRSNQTTNRTHTIRDLNKIMKPLYSEVILPSISKINDQLREEIGENEAPKFKLITNVNLEQNDLNRNFIQIIFLEIDKEFNPLTNPYLLIEGEPTGKISFIKSDFSNVERLDQIENIYESDETLLKQKFKETFQHFIDKI